MVRAKAHAGGEADRESIDWDNITNSQIDFLISEYIHNEMHRKVLHYRLVDGYTYEKIADEMGMSVRQINNIVSKSEERLFKHL
jgi:DNA-directed RNA polymerase specialized sigma subunit